jgi:uncharacterized protein YndB with AHSA1/START domain
VTEPGIRVTRVFEAPRERVWSEWTRPDAFADWFGGQEMDVRPGGTWRATMFSGPGRREIRWSGEYREVDEPERLVFTVSDRPEEDAYELVSVILSDLGDGRTEMLFEQSGRMRPEEYERAKQGWGGFFDRIGERLA